MSKALLAAAAAAAGEAELQGEDYVSKTVHEIFARGEKNTFPLLSPYILNCIET